MKRGVWIVEFLHRLGWTPLEMPVTPTKREALKAAKRWRVKMKLWKYRAVRYVPAAELTRKPRKRRKRT